MKFTDTQVVADSSTKIPAEATGGVKGHTTPAAIAGAFPANAVARSAVNGLQPILDGLTSRYDNFKVVNAKADFPAAVSGVITLPAGMTYLLTDVIDLTGDRIETAGPVNIIGFSSETSQLTSSDLPISTPFITTDYSITFSNVCVKDVDTLFAIDGSVNTIYLDWEHFVIQNVPHLGTIESCNDFVFGHGKILNSNGLVFTGNSDRIGFNHSRLSGNDATGDLIRFDEFLTVARQAKLTYVIIDVNDDTTGISVSGDVVIDDESFILDTVKFSGTGTYLGGGFSTNSEKASFNNCVGILNTTAIANIYMLGNTVPTDITAIDDRKTVAGVSSTDGNNQKFTHILARNAMRYDSNVPRLFKIQCTFSETAPNNNILGFYIGVKKGGGAHAPNADFIPESEVTITSSGGRPDVGAVHALVILEKNDEVYLMCENNTGANDIVIDYFNMIIERAN